MGARGLRESPRRLGSDPGEGASFGLSCEVVDSQEGREAWESKMVSAWLFGKPKRRGWGERFIFLTQKINFYFYFEDHKSFPTFFYHENFQNSRKVE